MTDKYRDVAIAAIASLEILVATMGENKIEALEMRAQELKARIATTDNGIDPGKVFSAVFMQNWPGSADSEFEPDCENEGFEPDRAWDDEDDSEPDIDPAPAPVIEVKRRDDPDDDAVLDSVDEGKVTKLPGIKTAPLPNEHPMDLKGSGRCGMPPKRFRMREIGGDDWQEGTASELAKVFNTSPSQIYQWSSGKTESRCYEIERIN